MKIIQTFWSSACMDRMNVGYNGGWLERKYNYMSWCLSCLLLKSLYSRVELITDEEGKRILIDRLHLPYSHVRVELNDLNRYNANLWWAAKFYSYSIQKEPFIHVDGDFFLYKRPDQEIENAQLMVAGKINFHKPAFDRFLDYMQALQPGGDTNGRQDAGEDGLARGYNPGIFGGNHTSLISGFAKESLLLYDRNLDFINRKIDRITAHHPTMSSNKGEHPFNSVNTIIESYFLHSFVKNHGIEVTRAFSDPVYSENTPFLGIGARIKYSQPLHNKRNLAVCRQLEYRLRKSYPDHYYIILSAIKECMV
jgi:hypothetical protein